jgi:predicted patatin/cPLA2 family phospholipase
MPETYYDDHCYADGGVAGGIALDIAKKDGFKKCIVIHMLDCYNEQG